MIKPELTLRALAEEAKNFCEIESNNPHPNLLGVTDGKAVGTYVEHKFREYLQTKYQVTVGNSAKGCE